MSRSLTRRLPSLPLRVTVAIVLATTFLSQLLAGDEGPEMQAHFIDVGQGACTLLEFPCGALLIDTGAQDNDHVDQLVEYLRSFFRRRADLNNTLASVIITHPHIDHSRGLKAVTTV